MEEINAIHGTYQIVVKGKDWGPVVEKLIVHCDELLYQVDQFDLKVVETKQASLVALQHETKQIEKVYLSDALGCEVQGESHYFSIELFVHPEKGASPFTFLFEQTRNIWSNPYYLTITNKNHSPKFFIEKTFTKMIMDDVKPFTYHQDQGLAYASFEPIHDNHLKPLIIWFHGAGEGGTDPNITLLGNRVTRLVEAKIQTIMDGAFVLVPQTPTMWMDCGSGYTKDGVSIYTKASIKLIKNYVANHPYIDKNRIYIGGCSNGGYQTLNILFQEPGYFAAAFPICGAFNDAWITDEMLKLIKDIPVCFIHALSDQVVDIHATSKPTYQRLSAISNQAHLFTYDTIVDHSGHYYANDGVSPYLYNGHYAWVHALNNDPIINQQSLFEWLSKQKKSL